MTKSSFSDKYAQFRMLLIDARKAAGKTQVELSENLGKPQSFVSKYESGERRLDVVEFLDIAVALECDPHQILDQLLAER